MKNLTFHSLLRWKRIILPILTASRIHFSLRRLGIVLFELGSERVNSIFSSNSSSFVGRGSSWRIITTRRSERMHSVYYKFNLSLFAFSLAAKIDGDRLFIGSTSAPIYNPVNKTKVPDVLFYENPQVSLTPDAASFAVFFVRLDVRNHVLVSVQVLYSNG